MSGRALHVVLAILALFCAAALWRVTGAIGLHVPFDPNEGWNAYHAAAAMAGGPLYPPAGSYMVNNYPPLSFYFVGALGWCLGDAIIAGRIVSLASFGALAVGLYAAGRMMGAAKPAAVAAPLLFASGLLVFTDYVGMDDPQMLAHAIAMAGFLALLREPRGKTEVSGAALLFVLALFVKHNVIAMAFAMTLWLLLHDRRSAARLMVSGLVFLAAGLVVFRAVYGTNLLSLLVTPRGYSLADLEQGLLAWLSWSLLPLAGSAALAVKRRDDRHAQLCLIYAAVATLIGVSFLGGAGVDANVLFDADLALALAATLVIDRLTAGWRAAVVAAALAAPILAATAYNGFWQGSWLHPREDEAVLAGHDIAFIAGRPGRALCEMQSFCYWARRMPEVDVFNIGQAFDTGARSDSEIVHEIEAQRFAVIQFDPDSPYSLGENVHDAMARHYRLDHEDDYGAFYVPR